MQEIHGISEECYQGTVFESPFCSGQGSGASPAAWLTLIVILFNTIDKDLPDDRMTFLDIFYDEAPLPVSRCIC